MNDTIPHIFMNSDPGVFEGFGGLMWFGDHDISSFLPRDRINYSWCLTLQSEGRELYGCCSRWCQPATQNILLQLKEQLVSAKYAQRNVTVVSQFY